MPPLGAGERAARIVFLAFCGAVLLFLIAPILVVVPLSFNAEPYFTFTEGMLRLDPDAWSLRWYRGVAEDAEWHRALGNSILIGVSATLLTTVLGTLAALGLTHPAMPGRTLLTGLLISPLVTPLIISAVGMFFFYSQVGLAQTHLGLILAHTTLGSPFVVITVDEVVTVLFIGGLEQRTIPRQMWSGIREEISPAILAVAAFLFVFALLFMAVVEWLRQRGRAAAGAAGSAGPRQPPVVAMRLDQTACAACTGFPRRWALRRRRRYSAGHGAVAGRDNRLRQDQRRLLQGVP